MDITQNNYVLRLPGEHFELSDAQKIRELGINVWAGMEKMPIFDTLNKRFWVDHFIDQTSARLLTQARSLGLTQKKQPKGELIHLLVNHFQGLAKGNI